MGDKDAQAYNSLLSALNDLAKGQKEMVDLMRKMTNKEAST